MHKELMILGLLQRKPMHGYDIYRIIQMHGVLFAELKKANLYYLLLKLEKQGHVTAGVEKSTKGSRGERVRYTITPTGRQYFLAQLRESTVDYTSNAVSTALVFLPFVSREEAAALLKHRHQRILDRLGALAKEIGDITKHSRLSQLATIRLLEHLQLEARWTENVLKEVTKMQW